MTALMGDPTIAPEVIKTMKEFAKPGCRWAAYQNHAMDSYKCGEVQYLKVGPGCTFTTRPERMPDTKYDLGWKYLFVGWVDLEQGKIVPE